MRKALWVLCLSALLLPAFAAAQSAFDGTWKVDMNKVDFPKKPDVYLLQNGTYECKTCVPEVKVPADGQDHSVTGHPYYDSVAIKVVSDHQIEETDKKGGKTVATSKLTVSSDDKTMHVDFSDSSNSNADPVTGSGEAERVTNGPAGANAISGSWRTTKMDNISDNGITWSYKVSGDELTMTTPTGQSYTAKMNGTEAPMKGDPGITSVSVKPVGKNGLEEIDMRDGKVIGVMKAKLSSDGKTMDIVYEDKLHGTTMKTVATKQ
jgi:hypothetical protein